MASLRTIVGGRGSGGSPPAGVPRGIELLLKKAKADEEFARYFLERPLTAATELGLELSPTEARVLESMPRSTLETAIEHTRVAPAHVPLLRAARTAAALAMALAFVVAGPDAAATGVQETPYTIEESVRIVEARLRAVQEALEEYRLTEGEYPSTIDWVTSLLGDSPANPLEGLVPRSHLFDAWYQPLRYEGLLRDGKVVGYRLESLGADREASKDRVRAPIDPDRHAFVTPNPIALTFPANGELVAIEDGAGGVTIEALATHAAETAELVWILDRVEIGRTKGTHRVSFTAGPGPHELVVQDESGNSDFSVFEVTEPEAG